MRIVDRHFHFGFPRSVAALAASTFLALPATAATAATLTTTTATPAIPVHSTSPEGETGALPAVRTARGYFREVALGNPGCGPAIVAVDDDDTVWVALARTGQLARLMNGNLDTFDIGADSRPVGLAAGTAANGHPGAIWIAASYDNKILRFDVATRTKKEYKIEGEESWPFNIAIGPDGTIWFTQRSGGRVGHLFPATGRVEHYEVPTPNGGPAGLGIDPKSGTVWFSESYADRIGRLDPRTGKIDELVMSDASTGQGTGPAGLAIDASGGVWFSKLEGKIGHIAPGSREIEIFDAPKEALRTAGIAVAPDQSIWALALDGNLLLRYEPATRAFTQYPLPSGSPDTKPLQPPFARTARPFGIGISRQGDVWFSEQYLGQVGVLDVSSPTVEIASPRGKVELGLVPLTTRAIDRVSGVASTEATIDGRPVAMREGRLDLSLLAPGKHRLELAARDAAGNAATAVSEIDYAPNHLGLKDLLAGLTAKDARGTELRDRWIGQAMTLPKGEAGPTLDLLAGEFAAEQGHFRQPPTAALQATLAFQRTRGSSVDIAILDAAPYFGGVAKPVVIHTGDTVVWRYEPPSDGHSLSKRLHRIEIESPAGNVRSELLRAGQSFGHRFEATGQFAVRDTETADAAFVVEVVAK